MLIRPALLIFATALFGAKALAADPVQSLRVGFADLDITSPAGHSAVIARVTRAAEAVCGPLEDRSLLKLKQFRECRDAAIADAMPALHQAYQAALQAPRLASKDVSPR